MNPTSRMVHRTFVKPFEKLERSQIFLSSASARKPKKGDPTSLNVSALPIIKREVKNKLTRKQKCCLQDFQIQTYIIELSLLGYEYYKSNKQLAWSTDQLIVAIISTLRKDIRFWIKDSEVYTQIKEQGEFLVADDPQQTGSFSNVEQDRAISYIDLRSHISNYIPTTLFAANRFMRIPKLPLIIFPMIFQFIRKIAQKDQTRPEADFYLQDLIYTCLLRAKPHYKIELNWREINNFQKNQKFRRNVRVKQNPGQKQEFKNLGGFDEEVVSLVFQFKDFCHQNGMNLYAVFDRFQQMKSKQEETLAFTLNYCYQGYIKFLQQKGPIADRVFKMTPKKLDESIAFFHYDYYTPPQYDQDCKVDLGKLESLKSFIWNQRAFPGVFFDRMIYDNPEKLDLMADKFQRWYSSSQQKEKRSYIYFSDQRTEWTEQDHISFLKAVRKFNKEPLANKRIAKFMGKHIDPNHVRYERQMYNKKIKMEKNGEEYNS